MKNHNSKSGSTSEVDSLVSRVSAEATDTAIVIGGGIKAGLCVGVIATTAMACVWGFGKLVGIKVFEPSK